MWIANVSHTGYKTLARSTLSYSLFDWLRLKKKHAHLEIRDRRIVDNEIDLLPETIEALDYFVVAACEPW